MIHIDIIQTSAIFSLIGILAGLILQSTKAYNRLIFSIAELEVKVNSANEIVDYRLKQIELQMKELVRGSIGGTSKG